MRKLILLLILLSIAVTAPISAEEIKLTTIVPDQTVERSKKGAIGETYSNPVTIPDGSIPTSGFLVEGNVGIGTTSPAAKLDVTGNMRLAPTSQPASPQPGMIYYDSTAGNMYYYKGGASPGWVNLGGGIRPPDYDSGWVQIVSGLTRVLTHNLGGNNNGYLVDIELTYTTVFPTGAIHQPTDEGGWSSLTNTQITIFQQFYDSERRWRVRIWKYQ